jgi:hypothetical protein
MSELLFRLDWLAILAATVVYFALGGLWFAPPVFGRRWASAIGVARPEGWRPGARMLVGSLLTCFLASVATSILAHALDARDVVEGLTLGLVVGIGYGTGIAGTHASSPTNARPLAVAAIVGLYHVLGLTVVALMVATWG